jgi:Arc/MetJ-type ribon-helix-helix transcriptional regulator
MRIPKMVSLDEETAAIAANMENFSGFVREALRNDGHRRAIERVEELEAMLLAVRRNSREAEEQVVKAFQRRSWKDLKQWMILKGWI